MNKKILITSFFLANLLDMTVTSFLLAFDGWQELNRLALAKLAQGEWNEFLILKIAFTAVLIGSYALATTMESRWEYPLEKALQLGSLVVWGVQLWNAANVAATLAQRFI